MIVDYILIYYMKALKFYTQYKFKGNYFPSVSKKIHVNSSSLYTIFEVTLRAS